jgi:hypothetical protein
MDFLVKTFLGKKIPWSAVPWNGFPWKKNSLLCRITKINKHSSIFLPSTLKLKKRQQFSQAFPLFMICLNFPVFSNTLSSSEAS